MRQVEVAAKINVSPSTVSAWFNGERDIPSEYIKPLAEILNIDPIVVLTLGTVHRDDRH